MNSLKSNLLILLLVCNNLFLPAQSAGTRSAGEITFNDHILNNEFNKVYLLQPGENVIVNNISSAEIAIGLKNYFDVSNKLALTYLNHDSLSLKIISEYEKLDETVNRINFGLNMISENLQKANLQPSIGLLERSNAALESSNKQIDSAVEKLNEINSDLTHIQFANLWSILAAGIIGFAAGAIIF
jgi:hypothetical protein